MARRRLTFRVLPFAKVRGHVQHLMDAFTAEAFMDAGTAGVDWDYFEAHERAGSCALLCALDGKRLAGITVVFVTASPVFSKRAYGLADPVYLLPEYRKGMAGVLLLRKAEALAKTMGAQIMTFSVPPKQKRLHGLLIARGYSVSELNFQKRL